VLRGSMAEPAAALPPSVRTGVAESAPSRAIRRARIGTTIVQFIDTTYAFNRKRKKHERPNVALFPQENPSRGHDIGSESIYAAKGSCLASGGR
jgi:hypothetical protein